MKANLAPSEISTVRENTKKLQKLDHSVSSPCDITEAYIKRLNKNESPSMACPIAQGNPIVWAKGKGSTITDINGNFYYELSAGSGVMNVGYSHNKIIETVCQQAKNLTHTGWLNLCEPRSLLSEKLLNFANNKFDKLLFTVSGAEAIEVALKIAKIATNRSTILTTTGGFHGKTMGALTVTSRSYYKSKATNLDTNNFKLFYPYCEHCMFEYKYPKCNAKCFDYFVNMLRHPSFDKEEIAAIVIEPIQGAEGMILPPDEYITKLGNFCKETGILLIFDEIFTGLGRTGKRFAYEYFDLVPDILVMGKALGSGLPISAVLSSDHIMKKLEAFKHTSTFAGNPLATAVGLTTLEIIEEENLCQNAYDRGEQLLKGLDELKGKYSFISEVRGRGLMIGIELMSENYNKGKEYAKEFVSFARKNGLILLSGGTYGNVLKITPPLCLTKNETTDILSIISQTFSEINTNI